MTLACLSAVFLPEARAEKQLISIAVGQLKDHQLTSREVNINYLVESALFATKKEDSIPKQLYPVKSNEFAREITAVLLEWVVFFESKGFDGFASKSSDIETAEKKVSELLKNNSAWKSLASTNKEVHDVIDRKLSAKKFVKFKVESSAVPVTDDEAKAYFEENRVKFGNLPFENFKTNIVGFLSKKQVDRRLKDWFEVLQGKYKVRNFIGEIDTL